MRTSRIKPDNVGTYYHITNRIAGEPGYFPFDDIHREKMVQLLRENARLFTVEPIAYQMMGNHFHIILYAPAERLPLAEALARYNAYYHGKKPILDATDRKAAKLPDRLRDVSAFAGLFQQRFATWYNKNCPNTRRGKLWGDRFTSTILECGEAVWRCLCYVELNAVRAHLIADPADYRFGSWGAWQGSGSHPFADNFLKHMQLCIGGPASNWNLPQINDFLRVELARVHESDYQDATPQSIDAAMAAAKPPPGILVTIERRCRFWGSGLIIGSKKFVLETAAAIRTADELKRHRLQNLHTATGESFCAYRRLQHQQRNC